MVDFLLHVRAGCDAVRDAHVQGKLFFRVGAGCDVEERTPELRTIPVRVGKFFTANFCEGLADMREFSPAAEDHGAKFLL